MNRILKAGSVCLFTLYALGAANTASATSVILDEFDVNQGSSCYGSNPSQLCVFSPAGTPSSPNTASSFVDGSMITGQRDIKITSKSTATGASTGSDVVVSANKIAWNNQVDGQSTLVVQWDGDDDSGGTADTAVYDAMAAWDGLFEDDITDDLTWAGATDSFAFDILKSDVGFDYEILVTDKDSNVATFNGSSSTTITTLTTIFIPFADFSNFGSTDFEFIDNIQVTLTTTVVGSVDLSVDAFRKVPEPGSMAILATGLLGWGAMSRRRQKKTKS